MRGFDMGIIVVSIFPNYFRVTIGKHIRENMFNYIYKRFSVIFILNISGFAHMNMCEGPDMGSIFQSPLLHW